MFNKIKEFMPISHGGYHYEDVIKATDDTIRCIVKNEIKRLGDNTDLSHIDVSNVTNMAYLFLNSHFNGDIRDWDVSNVTDMTGMFINSKVDCDISRWNVSKVKKHECCFDGSPLEKQPSKQPKFNP